MATLPESPDEAGRPALPRWPGRPLGGATEAGRDAGTDDEPGRVDGWPGLLAAAAVGPFFAVDRLRSAQRWRPLSEFADDPDGLDARVAAALQSPLLQPLRGSIPDAVRIRVAASIAFLGIAARLVSPALGSTLSCGIVPIMSWDQLCWRPAPTGIIPLATGPVEGRATFVSSRATGPGAVAALRETVIQPTIVVARTVAARYRLSRRVARGNIASAIAGAALAVASSGRCTEQAAVELAGALLRQPELAGSGSFAAPDRTGPRFRRNSCCLLYRAGGGLCGDCVLAGDVR